MDRNTLLVLALVVVVAWVVLGHSSSAPVASQPTPGQSPAPLPQPEGGFLSPAAEDPAPGVGTISAYDLGQEQAAAAAGQASGIASASATRGTIVPTDLSKQSLGSYPDGTADPSGPFAEGYDPTPYMAQLQFTAANGWTQAEVAQYLASSGQVLRVKFFHQADASGSPKAILPFVDPSDPAAVPFLFVLDSIEIQSALSAQGFGNNPIPAGFMPHGHFLPRLSWDGSVLSDNWNYEPTTAEKTPGTYEVKAIFTPGNPYTGLIQPGADYWQAIDDGLFAAKIVAVAA